ncbi:MAG: DUF1643 domain-containing protein [Pseudomonadota bacterium]
MRGDAPSWATYSDCDRYRYALTRCWDPGGAALLYILLNPSKATEIDNDPTVERCERRARALGFGAFRVTNIFAWRDTDPRALRQAQAPVGPQNDEILRDSLASADLVIAGWGAHGAHRDRGSAVALLLKASGVPIHHLGLTKDGHPRHPLYIAYRHRPVLWDTLAEG